ncbi:C40 family peptidase [Egicoccus sp. AB-alg6-2]|uniref:C40 family peptidase n=1 Tax=Egicoccus sp. AB-alg6-2 TaxID=3242692 RepID=UPI00359E3B8E
MPVSAIAASPAPATDVSPSAPPQVTPGFSAALDAATARFDPARLPTVSLGTMVAAMAAADPQQVADAVAAATVDPSSPISAATAIGQVSAGDGSMGQRILAAGERYLGVPYKWGGTNPAVGLDCSGFVQQTFGDLGIRLPRVSVDQARAGRPVASLAEARPGDLVFWRAEGKRPNHIGIYAGDNKMLVAPRTGDVVRYQEMNRTPHAIRRIA